MPVFKKLSPLYTRNNIPKGPLVIPVLKLKLKNLTSVLNHIENSAFIPNINIDLGISDYFDLKTQTCVLKHASAADRYNIRMNTEPPLSSAFRIEEKTRVKVDSTL